MIWQVVLLLFLSDHHAGSRTSKAGNPKESPATNPEPDSAFERDQAPDVRKDDFILDTFVYYRYRLTLSIYTERNPSVN